MNGIVKNLSSEYSIREVCSTLGTSRSSFYQEQKTSSRDKQNTVLLREIKEVHEHKFKRFYGSPRMHLELRRRGHRVGLNRVARLMKRSGMRAFRRRRFRHTTSSRHSFPRAQNLLQRDFSVGKANKNWVGDITYLETLRGFVYLAAVIDVGTRRWLGYALSDSLQTELCTAALKMAMQNEKPPKLIHHDQGSQYASAAYQKLVAERGSTLSMSRKGNCWDNAIAESFFDKFKNEAGDTFADIHDARRETFDYFLFYNRDRIHSSLGSKPPMEFTKQLESEMV